MTKQRITIGSVLEININNEYYCYAQILGKAYYVFFDLKTTKKISDFSILETVPILFVLSVYNDVITSGKWIKTGKLRIREELKVLPLQFIQDSLHPDKFELYNPNTGEISPTTEDTIQGLECAAVWDAEHVESRIADYYNGSSNYWVEQLNK